MDNLYEETHSIVPMTYEELLPIMKQLIIGINLLHENNIIHRDIKEANILYDKNSHTVKLIDFGAACYEDFHGKSSCYDTIIGTDLYLPPEYLILPSEDYEKFYKAQDIWALGVTLFNLSHGFTPWYNNCGSHSFYNKRMTFGCHYRAMLPNSKVANIINRCLTVPWESRITSSELITIIENESLEMNHDENESSEKGRDENKSLETDLIKMRYSIEYLFVQSKQECDLFTRELKQENMFMYNMYTGKPIEGTIFDVALIPLSDEKYYLEIMTDVNLPECCGMIVRINLKTYIFFCLEVMEHLVKRMFLLCECILSK